MYEVFLFLLETRMHQRLYCEPVSAKARLCSPWCPLPLMNCKIGASIKCPCTCTIKLIACALECSVVEESFVFAANDGRMAG